MSSRTALRPITIGLTVALVAAAALAQGPSTPPPAQAPPAPDVLPPPSPLDPTVTVDAVRARPGAGTAFSVSPGGIWLTARHVVDGCPRTVIEVAPGQGVAAEVRIDPGAETAVLITQGGAPALPLAPRRTLRAGMVAFHAGFPDGHPGQVSSRLMRRETLVLRGRHSRRESVLTWERDDDPGAAPRNLAGLSGAPALDSFGRVIGVTLAQSERRGRIYTTTPGALAQALERAHIQPASDAEPAPMTMSSYRRVSRDLRGDLRIVRVVCMGT